MGLECLFPPTASSSSMNSTQGLWTQAVFAGGVAGSEYTHRACGHGQSLQGEWQGQSTNTGLVGMGSLCRGSGRVRVHTQACGHGQSLQGEWQGQSTHTGLVGGQSLQGEWQGQSTHTGLVGMGSLCRGSGRVRVHTWLVGVVVSAGGVAGSESHMACGRGSLCRGSGRVRVHTGLVGVAVSAGGVAGSTDMPVPWRASPVTINRGKELMNQWHQSHVTKIGHTLLQNLAPTCMGPTPIIHIQIHNITYTHIHTHT